MTTANLGEAVTTAAAWWQSHLRSVGLGQTDINNIDTTNEPVLHRRCREAVMKKTAIQYMRAMAPGETAMVEAWQRDLDLLVTDLKNDPAGFLAELYSGDSHSQFRSHIQSPGATDSDADTDNDDVTPVVRRDDSW